MKITETEIGGAPAVLYGDGAEKAYLFVHGLFGNKYEAERFALVVSGAGYDVLAVDLPEHGGRDDGKKLVPWEVVPQRRAALGWLDERYAGVSLRTTSVGTYFSLLAAGAGDVVVEKCLAVSPLVDMVTMINGVMAANGVDDDRLERERVIEVPGGQPLSWEYLTYAKEHPVTAAFPVHILYGEKDEVIPFETVKRFAEENSADITVIPVAEHWIHLDDEVAEMEKWERGMA